MKSTFLFSALLFAGLATTFVSCKKETPEQRPQALILGTWNIEASGVDANKNDVLEASESDTLDPSEIAQLIFSENGLGVSRYGPVADSLEEERFKWSLSTDGKTLRIDQGLIFNHVVTQLTQNRLAYYFEEKGEHHFEIWKR